MPADIIALKRLSSWKEYIPGDFICVVVTSEYKVLRKVSVTQPDEQSINFTQMVDGTPVESSIPKDIIVEIYKVVGNYRRQWSKTDIPRPCSRKAESGDAHILTVLNGSPVEIVTKPCTSPQGLSS